MKDYVHNTGVPTGGKMFVDKVLSFEEKCAAIERDYEEFSCSCCAGENARRCDSCRHALGFHKCQALGCVRWPSVDVHGQASVPDISLSVGTGISLNCINLYNFVPYLIDL